VLAYKYALLADLHRDRAAAAMRSAAATPAVDATPTAQTAAASPASAPARSPWTLLRRGRHGAGPSAS
jgi:hypothetical protein